MPYVGTGLNFGGFTATIKDSFTGDGSATDFTLSRAPSNAFDIEVFVGNVRQNPNVAYTVSGTTLAFTGTPASGEVIYAVHQAGGGLTTVLPQSFLGVKDYTIGGNLNLNVDNSSALKFGADQDVTMTHVADSGLTLKNTSTADDTPFVLILQTGETDIAADDVLGSIRFQAPDEGTGTDALLVAAAIDAVSEGDFSASSNASKLSFKTGSSETATEKMALTSDGKLNLLTDATVLQFGADSDVKLTHVADTGLLLNASMQLQFNDASQNINAPSATVLDINATDEIELNATLVDVNANLDVSGTIVGGGAITGGGLLTTGGNIVIPDAGFIGSASDTDAIQIEADGDIVFSQDVAITGTLTVNGTTTTVNSTTVTVDDPIFTLGGDSAPGSDDNKDRGIEFRYHNGSAAKVGFFGFDDSTSAFTFIPDATNSSEVFSGTVGNFVVGDISVADDMNMVSDSAQITFGANSEVTLTHVHDSGLALKHTATADDKPIILTLQTGETDMAANDVIGAVRFQAPDEGTGTDAILVAAAIQAVSEGDFSASSNATRLEFHTGASEAASSKMSLSSAGLLTITDDLIIGDGKTIGSASDPDAITIASNGQLTLTQTLIGTALDISGDIDVDGTTNLDVVDIDGAVDMASTLQVDGAITSSAGMTITTADNNASLTLVSTDADANSGPLILLDRNSSSPADSDRIAEIVMRGRNDAGQSVDYIMFDSFIVDASDGSEASEIDIRTMVGGSEATRILLDPAETVFNEASIDVDFRVESNGNTHMLFVDAGNDKVGIGTNSPAHLLDATVSSGGASARFGTTHSSGANNGTVIINNGGTGDAMLRFDYEGNNDRARIGVTQSGQQLEFYTAGDNERMRISSDGNVGIGATSGGTLLHVERSTDGGVGFFHNTNASMDGTNVQISTSRNTTNNSYYHLACSIHGVAVKFLVQDGGNVQNVNNSYGAISDQRMKENIVDSPSQWDDIKAVQVRKYNRLGETQKELGVIAQELEASGMGGLVEEGEYYDVVNNPDNEIRKGVKYSILHMKAVKALQEAMARIETLETEVQKLKDSS